jgi:hypothetical protein
MWRKLAMTWLFLTDFFSIYGVPMGWYRKSKPLSEQTHTHRVFRDLAWDPGLENSRCVDFFRPNSFPHMMHLGCHIGGKDPIRIVLSHNEISRGQSQSQVEKTRYGLTFFARFLFHIWFTNGVVSEKQTAFGTDSHTSSFPWPGVGSGLGKLEMCWLFSTDFFSIYGAPTVLYRGKRPHSERTHTRGYIHAPTMWILGGIFMWALTFFDWCYCLFWETTVCIQGEIFLAKLEWHTQRGMVRQEGFY